MSTSGESFVRPLLLERPSTARQPQQDNQGPQDMSSMAFGTLARNWVLTLTYTLDWVVIIAFAAAGGGLNFVSPQHRAFSVLDLSISFPIRPEVSIVTVAIVAGLVPAIIIFLVVAVWVPGRSVSRYLKRAEAFRIKAWELEKGWAGLALALATSFFITQGSKQLFGKPRPDMLARCQPDLTNIASYAIGGYGQSLSPEWILVNTTICMTTDRKSLDDGFRSFPSGHSSFSWAGLLYLTLFLCAKFNIVIPHLPMQQAHIGAISQPSQRSDEFELQPTTSARAGERIPKRGVLPTSVVSQPTHRDPFSIRNQAASPPNYLLIPALLPVAVAFYIGSTRFADYYHFGFDIIAGSLLGIATAWFSFRWYHLPLGRGHGWAWGSRSQARAFGIGVGTEGYVDHDQRVKADTSNV